MIVCVVFLEIAPALPAYAATAKRIKEDTKIETPLVKNKLSEKPIQNNWSEVNWDDEVVLLSESQKNSEEMQKLLAKGQGQEAKNLQPKKTKLSSDQALDYYNVPGEVREAVVEYREGVGMFAKKDENSKEYLKNYIKTLLPAETTIMSEKQDNPNAHVLDISKEPKLKIKNIKAAKDLEKPVEFKITNSHFKFQKSSLQNVTLRGIEKQVKEKGLTGKKLSVQSSVVSWLKNITGNLFAIETVNATASTTLIAYYNGIEKNTLDNALYYISNSQNTDGSFAQVSKYEETGETALALADVGRTNSTQFLDALNYLINTAPQNNREKAIKARLMVGLGQPYQVYLDEFIAEENSDHGYGMDIGYESDILTTMEGALAMYSANYSIQDKLPLSLYYVLSHIPDNGALKYNSDGPVSYYLINRVVQSLKPFQSMTVANDQGVNISVQNKINSLLTYLSSQFSDDTQTLLGTADAIDEVMILRTWKMYGVESARQKVLENKLVESQYIDGSFGNSLRANVQALQTLDKPDLVLSNLQSSGTLESRQAAVFNLTVENRGYAPATNSIIYIFADNVNTGMTINLGTAGITIQPNETINLNLTIPDTKSYTGSMDLKFYIEPSIDVDFDNNWIYGTFSFAPAADGTPALPMYYAAFKYSLNGNPAIIATIPTVQKTDPNRSGYILLFKEHGTTDWQMTNYNPNLYIIGYFPEGAYYDFTVGVLDAAGVNVTYFSNITTIHLSANDNLYTGSASGRITLDNQNMPNTYAFIQAGLSTTTNQNGEFYGGNGQNGKLAAWVDKSQYEQIRGTFSVQEGQTTENVRIFTHLKPDTTIPVSTSVELRYSSNGKIKNQKEYSLFNFGTDNVAIKEGDFYLWNPIEQIWTFLGTATVANSSYVTLKWYVSANLPLTTGYKIKGILRDYRGNESVVKESTSFEIIDGTAPQVIVIAPNGGEEWLLGTTNTINWSVSSTGGVSNVNLYYEYPDSYNSIQSSVPNTGSYDWFIPYRSNYSGDKFKIRVTANDNVNSLSGMDSSDNYFSIKDPSAKPADPWAMPGYLQVASTTAPITNFDNYQITYDETGVAHLVYHYTEDFVTVSPRVIVERLYYTKYQNNVWAEPEVAYEKIWETDNNLTGYMPIGNLKLTMVGANPNLIWRSAGGTGGCASFSNQEIYHYYLNGSSWVGPTNLSNNNTSSDSPDLVADSNGNLTVVWNDGIIWDENCVTTGTRKMFYGTKTNGGNWGSFSAFNELQYPSSPKLAVTTGNKVNLVVVAGMENVVKHYVLSGGNWSNEKIVPGANNVDYPVLQSYNDKLHYVYRNYYSDPILGSRSRILYTYFDGTNWQSITEISPIESGIEYDYPSLAVAGIGSPQVIFHRQNNSANLNSLVWTNKLANGTWLTPQKISLDSQNISNYETVVAGRDNKLMAIWNSYYSFKSWPTYNTADLAINYLPPEPVTGFTGQAATNSISLSWDAYNNADNDFSKFEISRGVSSSSVSMVKIAEITNVSTTSFIDTNAVTTTENYYIITIFDTAGHAVATNPIGPLLPNIVSSEIDVKLMSGANIESGYNYNFGSYHAGVNPAGTVFVINNSEVNLDVHPSLISGGENCFLSVEDTAQMTLAPFTSTSLELSMSATSTGSHSCSLAIENNDPNENSFIINFSGETLPDRRATLLMHFNENNGSVEFLDSSENNGKALCTGQTCPNAGVSGIASSTALLFDGVNDFTSINDSENIEPGQSFTLEAWIKPFASPNYYTVVATKALNYEMTITNNGGFRTGLINASGTRVVFDIPNVVNMFQWNHVATTYDGTMIRAYVNGVKVGERPQTGLVRNDNNQLLIGNYVNTYPFFGSMDEVKLYKEVLSSSEIATEYNNSKPSPVVINSLVYELNEQVNSTRFFDEALTFPLVCLGTQCPTAGVPGLTSSTGLLFDGTNDSLSANDSEYLEPGQALTLEAWIKPFSGPNYYTVIATKGLNYEMTAIGDGGIRVGITNTAGTRVVFDTPKVINMSEWNHVALTYDGAMIRVYANGVKVGEKAQTGLVRNDSSPFLIGNLSEKYPFFGLMDKIKLYKRVLSAVEVATEYNSFKPDPFVLSNLKYQFNEQTSSTKFYDMALSFPLACTGTQCPTVGVSGIASSTAIQFTGANKFLYANDSSYIEPGQALTLEVWIKPTAGPNYYSIVVTKGLNYEVTITNNGGLRMGITNASSTRLVVDTVKTITMSEWNHLALTYDGVMIRSYVNGVKVGEKAQTGAIRNDNSTLLIGNLNNVYPFFGTMDDLKVYKQALSDAEIVTEYNNSKPN